jgi:hypothetical protein
MKLNELFEAAKDIKTLYCSRKLLNGDDVVEWAKEQGFTKCLDPSDMHVTICFSKKPIDWSNLTDSFDNVQSSAGSKREIQLFGDDKTAVVLTFECADLNRRFEEFRDDFGATSDFPEYRPHISISYAGLPDGLELKDIKPYDGVLKFGPEIMKPVKLDWKKGVEETVLEDQENVSVTDTKPFKQWFKDSKVVGTDGKPLVVYHGTSSNFRAFNIKKSVMSIIWFTSDKSKIENGESGAQGRSKVLELYASIQNPADWKAYDQLGLGELISRGYDGAILPDGNGHFDGFVFEPNQLKSATQNRGNFDVHNKNLREEL